MNILKKLNFSIFKNETKVEEYIPKLRIQKSITPEGKELDHTDLMIAKDALRNSHVIGKETKLCMYDYSKHTCRCGITLNDLKNNKHCPNKSI